MSSHHHLTYYLRWTCIRNVQNNINKTTQNRTLTKGSAKYLVGFDWLNPPKAQPIIVTNSEICCQKLTNTKHNSITQISCKDIMFRQSNALTQRQRSHLKRNFSWEKDSTPYTFQIHFIRLLSQYRHTTVSTCLYYVTITFQGLYRTIYVNQFLTNIMVLKTAPITSPSP